MTANSSLLDGNTGVVATTGRGVHGLLAKLDGPISRHPLRAMLFSAAIGLPLLLAAGFFHLTFEEGYAAGREMALWESQGMPLGFMCLSIAATAPAYVFAGGFLKAKLMAIIACGLGGAFTLPFLLGHWVHEGKFGLTAACVVAVLILCFVAFARTAAPNRRLAVAALAVATVVAVFAVGTSGALGLGLPLGALSWLALPLVAMRVLRPAN